MASQWTSWHLYKQDHPDAVAEHWGSTKAAQKTDRGEALAVKSKHNKNKQRRSGNNEVAATTVRLTLHLAKHAFSRVQPDSRDPLPMKILEPCAL